MSGGVMVVGAGGFIGRHLVTDLGRRGHVVALCRTPPEGGGGSTGAPVRDVAVPGFTEGLPTEVETVVHLAQSRRFREFPEGAPDVFAVNVGSVVELLDWSVRAGVRRFVLASSGGIYGHGTAGFKEDDAIGPSRPLGYYLASKHAAELFAEAYDGRLTIVILRFFFVYGPGQQPTMFLPRLVRSVAAGQPILLDGSSGLRSNPVHVEDAVRALAVATTLTESRKINVAGPDVMDLREMGGLIGSYLGRMPAFETRQDESAGDLVGDITRMATVLGSPRVALADGLRQLCRDLQDEAAGERPMTGAR